MHDFTKAQTPPPRLSMARSLRTIVQPLISTTGSMILAVSQVSVIQAMSTSLFLITISRSSILFTRDLVFDRNKEGEEICVVGARGKEIEVQL